MQLNLGELSENFQNDHHINKLENFHWSSFAISLEIVR